MARPILSGPAQGARPIAPRAPDAVIGDESGERAESRFRLITTLAVLYCTLQAVVGTVWDVQWHAVLGRDSFWIPPHLMVYSGVLAGGLIEVFVVLLETLRYYRGTPGVDDRTTAAVLGAFHAPLGLTVCGFGSLTLLFAAPFDNYWHSIYGIDVTIWAPFHVMGLIGACIVLLGLLYACSDLLRRAAAGALPAWPAQAALLLTLAVGLIVVTGLLAEPTIWEHPLMPFYPPRILIYPLIVSGAAAMALVCAARVLPWTGAATALAALLTVFKIVLGAAVPAVMTLAASLTGSVYRPDAPTYAVIPFVLPSFLLVAGLLVDALFWLFRRSAGRAAVPRAWAFMVAGALVALALTLLDRPWTDGVDPAIAPRTLAMTLPLALLAGVLAGWLGGGLGHALTAPSLRRGLSEPFPAVPDLQAQQTVNLRPALVKAVVGLTVLAAIPTWIIVAPPNTMSAGTGWAIGLAPLLGIVAFALSQ